MLHLSTLPFKRYQVKNNPAAFDYVLPEDLFVEQWTIPAGTTVKLKTTRDFGFVVLPVDCKDITGYKMHKRIFQY